MATSKVAVIAFPAQTSILVRITSADQISTYPKKSPLVRLETLQRDLRPNLPTQGEADSQLKEAFVQRGPEQTQLRIIAAPICANPILNPRGPHDAFEKQEERNGISTRNFESLRSPVVRVHRPERVRHNPGINGREDRYCRHLRQAWSI
jgi:hypothetical protein